MAHSPVESYALPSSPQPRSWTAILRQEAPWVGALTLAALAILLRYGHDFGYWQYVVLASWYAGLLTAGIAWRPLQYVAQE